MTAPQRQRRSIPGAHRPGRRRACTRAVAIYALASLAPLGLAADRATPQVQLAASGDNPFLSFLNGLFGVEPSRNAPRRQWRPPPARQRLPAPRPPTPRVVPQPAVARPMEAVPEPPPAAPETYRTMCVRLCDGYYWPISFATTKEGFARDQRTCERSCGATAMLYYYPNPGGALEDMISLQGIPYKSLGAAFLYRTTYDARCKCQAHPWERDALERHKRYASPTDVQSVSQSTPRSR